MFSTKPSYVPTEMPSLQPSSTPSSKPLVLPTEMPSLHPSLMRPSQFSFLPSVSLAPPTHVPTEIPGCEKPEYIFFYKMNKNGKLNRKKCAWLAKKSKSKRKKICKRNVDYDEVGWGILGPAQTVCKDSCTSCDPCYENEKSKYVYYKKVEGFKRTCKKISSLSPTAREHICAQEHVNSAKNVCPVSCEVDFCK